MGVTLFMLMAVSVRVAFMGIFMLGHNLATFRFSAWPPIALAKACLEDIDSARRQQNQDS